jgi:hypothetical protein
VRGQCNGSPRPLISVFWTASKHTSCLYITPVHKDIDIDATGCGLEEGETGNGKSTGISGRT